MCYVRFLNFSGIIVSVSQIRRGVIYKQHRTCVGQFVAFNLFARFRYASQNFLRQHPNILTWTSIWTSFLLQVADKQCSLITCTNTNTFSFIYFRLTFKRILCIFIYFMCFVEFAVFRLYFVFSSDLDFLYYHIERSASNKKMIFFLLLISSLIS